MKRDKFIELLEKEFPKSSAISWKSNGKTIKDNVGLLIKGKDEVNRVLVSLDITTDVIMQAIEDNFDTIISHHPLWLGNKEEWFKANKFDQAKHELIKLQKINYIAIHTNADFNDNSIAYNQAKLLGATKVNRILNNQAVEAVFEDKIENSVLFENVQKKLSIDYDLRTNLDLNGFHNRLVICSGSCGDLIKTPELHNSVFMPGEIKHHHWVYAQEQQIKVLETGHYSENLFKAIVKTYLNNKASKLEVELANEENGY